MRTEQQLNEAIAEAEKRILQQEEIKRISNDNYNIAQSIKNKWDCVLTGAKTELYLLKAAETQAAEKDEEINE